MVFKAARCPNCSGELMLDPSKKTGFCMHCGSDIIVEDAINKVQVDGVASADNLLEMAQRSKEMSSYTEAANYFNKYLELMPDNYVALYEKSLLTGFQSTSDNNRIKEVMKGVNIALNNATESDAEYIKQKVVNDMIELADVVFSRATRQFEGVSLDNNDLANLYNDYTTLSLDIIEMLKQVLEYAPDNYHIWERINHIASGCTARMNDITKKLSFSYCLGESPSNKLRLGNQSQAQKIHMESSLKSSQLNPNPSTGKPEGCYVATVAYNDHNAPQVIILRQYRDQVLLNTITGRIFVKLYYWKSPSIAGWLNDKNRINAFIRNRLDIFIKIIRNRHTI